MEPAEGNAIHPLNVTSNGVRKLVQTLVVAGLVLALDVATKQWALQRLPGRPIRLVEGFWNFVYVENRSSAFNLTEIIPYSVRHPLLVLVTIVAAVVITWFAVGTQPEQRLLRTGFAFLLGGAVGNLIDRLRFGYVIDFVDWYVGQLHWPAFNIADSAIVAGIALVMLKSPKKPG